MLTAPLVLSQAHIAAELGNLAFPGQEMSRYSNEGMDPKICGKWLSLVRKASIRSTFQVCV